LIGVDPLPVFIGANNNVVGVLLGDHATINTKDASFTYEPGTRLTVGRFLGQDIVNRDHSLEFTYLGLLEFSNSATLRTSARLDDVVGLQTLLGQTVDSDRILTTNLFEIGNVDGFTGALSYFIKYESDFNSFETNIRVAGRPLRDRLTLQPSGTWVRHASPSRWKSGLIGLRFISINDMFGFQSAFRDPTQNSGNYVLKTHNDMVGPQVGGEIANHYGDWSWGGRFKAGALVNFGKRENRVDILSVGVASQRTESITDEHLAGLVEAGMFAEYHVTPNFVGRIGYDFLYVTGIAAAPQNLSLAAEFPVFDITGDALLHGLSLGFEMLW
jgi:hypothetical protein